MNLIPPRLIPELETGDHLSRAEFERRYDAMPNLKKAELIEGVVFMPSPVRMFQHSYPHGTIVGLLFNYSSATPGVWFGDNGTVRLDDENEPQPDGFLVIDPNSGGNAKFSDDDYVEGAPELVVEVASSSVSFDLNTKLAVYLRNRVQEYLVWRVVEAEFDWFVLRDDQYIALPNDATGLVKSTQFPGFWLDRPSLLRGDMLRVQQVLQQGIASPEHADFVHKLAARKKNS